MPDRAGTAGAAATPISPLELLLPEGAARHVLLLGGGCPLALRRSEGGSDGVAADLIILAPTNAECQRAGWFEQQADTIDQALAPDGLVYLLAPRRWRRRQAAALQQRGLVVTLSVAHLPDQAASRYLVPLAFGPAHFALTRLLPARRARRGLALLALRLPYGAWMLSNALPAVGLVARRPRAAALFGWMFPGQRRGGSAVIALSGPGKAGVTLHGLADHERAPSAIVKLALAQSSAASLVAEAARLGRLGSDAAHAGAQVPRARLVALAPGRPALFQTVLRGRPIALVLADKPLRLAAAIEAVAGWLERWGTLSHHSRTVGPDWLRQHLLDPLELLAPRLAGGAGYRRWLLECCAAVTGTDQPFVAAHNDLTMWNILWDEPGNLGVVDWEGAQSSWFPLADLLYAATDAVAASQGYADRLAAFQACFAAGGPQAASIETYCARIRQILGMTEAWAQICFHACWLHHAANEQRACAAGQPRPFGRIVEWLACRHDQPLEAS